MAAPSRRLVIDASVASAAGLTLHPNSYRSREFLGEVLKISHRMVLTASLAAEWGRHQSLYSATWMAEMRSRDKVVNLVEVHNDEVRSQVTMTTAVQKDLHLIEAAMMADQIVVSLDDRAQAQLCVDSTKEIVWVNAVTEGGHAIYWLRSGALPKDEWKLGYHP